MERIDTRRAWSQLEIKQLISQQLEELDHNKRTSDKLLSNEQRTMEQLLRLWESDPHQFSNRPCQTCNSITALTGIKFGCVKRYTE